MDYKNMKILRNKYVTTTLMILFSFGLCLYGAWITGDRQKALVIFIFSMMGIAFARWYIWYIGNNHKNRNSKG